MRSLSTVVTVTLTVPCAPGGAVAITSVVDPQNPKALPLRNFLAGTGPKDTPVTQPRFCPVTVTTVPPTAGPEAGLTESATGLPGGKKKK